MSSCASQSFELSERPKMNTIRDLFRPKPAAYEALDGHEYETASEDGEPSSETAGLVGTESPFSWAYYSGFLLLGIAMLWAWNMFLAAAPYFDTRFESNKWIRNHFQPAEISVASLTILVSMFILSKMQIGASYPRRIILGLCALSAGFALLAISTQVQTSAPVYFAFLVAIIFVTSCGTSLVQNATFAFVGRFNHAQYTQGIMTGQGIAGVLPSIVQIISVAVAGSNKAGDTEQTGQSPTAALAYFVAAVVVSLVALAGFLLLLRHVRRSQDLDAAIKATSRQSSERTALANEGLPNAEVTNTAVPLTTLFMKMPYLAVAIMLCFAVSMIFPVFAVSVFSVSGIDAAMFIPLAFLLWNLGDLSGRLITLSPQISLTHYPFALFCVAMARLLFIPLFFLCNIKGRGAAIPSDFFYLIVVQYGFGLTNGYLSSQCMMGASEWVLPEERPAAGSFMSLALVTGLTIGSFLSFLLGDI